MVPGVGHIQHTAAELVVEMPAAPVDPPVALGQRRGELVAVGEGVDRRDQVVPVALLEQIGADGLDRLHPRIRLGGDTGQILAGQFGEFLAVGLVPERQIPQMQNEIVLEEFDVLGEPYIVQPARCQQRIDTPVNFQPVLVVGHFVPAVRHRFHGAPLMHVPEIDLIGNQGDAAGREVRVRDEHQVLVEHSLGEAQIILDEEFAAVALVGGEGVPDEKVGKFGDRLQGARGGVEPGVPLVALLVSGVLVQPYAQPGDDVRTGLLGGLQHIPAGIELQYVVAVQEHDVLTGGVLNSGVTRFASRAAVLR